MQALGRRLVGPDAAGRTAPSIVIALLRLSAQLFYPPPPPPIFRRGTGVKLLPLVLALVASLTLFNHGSVAADPVRGEVQNLQLSSPAPGQLVIAWDEPGETPSDYRVTWTPSGQDFPSYRDDNASDRGNAYPTANTHTVDDLPAGTELKVMVRARYNTGEHEGSPWSGPWTDEATITVAGATDTTPAPTSEPTAEPTSDGTVTGLTLTSDAAGSLAIRWDTPSPAPSDYRVVWTPSGEGYPSYRDANASDRGNAYPTVATYTVDDLPGGTEYKVRVRARYNTGEHADAPWSGPWTEATQRVRGDAPAAPTGLSASDGSDGTSVDLSWTAPDHNGLTGYRIWRGAEAGSLAVLVDDTGDTSTAYTDATAEADTSYAYAVAALSIDGDSPRSETANIDREGTIERGEIGELTVSSDEVGILDFSWSAPDPAPNYYQLSWIESHLPFLPESDYNGNFWDKGTSMRFGVSIVEPGVTYKLRVRADYRRGPGNGEPGPWTEVKVQRVRSHPPQAPADLRVDSAGHDGVSLSWTAPRHDVLTGYRVLRGSSADDLAPLAEDTGGVSTSYTDTTTEADTTYAYAVVALSIDGDSRRSDTVTATLPPRTPVTPVIDGAPAAPAGLTAALDGSGGVTLTWTDPDDAGITGYRVLRGVDDASLAVIVEDTGSGDVTYTDTAPVPDETRVYAVQARNAAGLGQLSDTVPATALSAPWGLYGDPGAFLVELTWNGPGHGAVTGYQVLRGTDPDAMSVAAEDTGSAETGYADGPVEPETTYHYAVRARSAQGLGPPSAPLTVRTTEAASVFFVGPQSSQQQTAVTLVSNSDAPQRAHSNARVSASSGGFSETQVMGFRTGRHPGGYTLSGVRVYVHIPSDPWTKPELHILAASATGELGPQLRRLTAGEAAPGAAVTFSPSTPLTLNPNTSCGELDWELGRRSGVLYTGTDYSAAPRLITPQPSPLDVAILGNQVTTRGESERECEDGPAGTNTYLKLGGDGGWGSAMGAMHSKGDLDWYAVTLEAGVEYEFGVSGALSRGGPGSLGPGGTVQHVEVRRVLDSSGAAQTFHRVEDDPPTYYRHLRGYFTPDEAGTYYLEVDPRGSLNVPFDSRSSVNTYSVRMRKADDYSADAMTTASVQPGGIVGGFFFSPHDWDSVNNRFRDHDVDWVRVSLKAGVSYLFSFETHASALTQARIMGIYNSSSDRVANGAYAIDTANWASAPFTPSADGDYYVALTSHQRYARHPAPSWRLKVWSSDQPAISEPQNGDLPGLREYGNPLGAGAVPNDGAAASGRTPTTADGDLYGVWLNRGVRYRITAYETSNLASQCLQMQLYDYPLHNDVATAWKLAAATPNPLGDATLFHTPRRSGLHYVHVSHRAVYDHKSTIPSYDRCALKTHDDPSDYDLRDFASSYDVVVQPASANRDVTTCHNNKITGWVAPGQTVNVAYREDDHCGVGMELTQGTSYTVPMPDDSYVPGRVAENVALNASVLASVHFGGPRLTVDRTIFELRMGL